jgi:hypothetical protein
MHVQSPECCLFIHFLLYIPFLFHYIFEIISISYRKSNHVHHSKKSTNKYTPDENRNKITPISYFKKLNQRLFQKSLPRNQNVKNFNDKNLNNKYTDQYSFFPLYKSISNRFMNLLNKASSSLSENMNQIECNKEKERILNRFRNSFINLAQPLVVFSGPVAAETFRIKDASTASFNLWDHIDVSIFLLL